MRMMRMFRAMAAAALVLSAPMLLNAQSLRDKLTVHRMENGFTVLVYPRSVAPVFSGVIAFDIGSTDEPIGQTGIAHMFEHMAFKGTRTIGTRDFKAEVPLMEEMDKLAEQALDELRKVQPDQERVAGLRAEIRRLQEEQSKYIIKDEFDLLVQGNGASGMNASTSMEQTTYFMSMPKNRLELFIWLEAERMRDPVMREFYSERDVVVEERRMRTDDSPFGYLMEAFLTSAFRAHPYGTPIIGWPSDVANLTRRMADEFAEEFYGPESAVMAIVGDVDPAEVIRLADKYFGTWQSTGKPQRLTIKEPRFTGESRIKVKFDAEPTIMVGWHKPTFPHPDAYVFEVLDSILVGGRTSRCYKILQEEKMLAVSVQFGTMPGEKYDNLVAFIAQPRAPHTVHEVEEAIYEILADIAENGVTEYEHQRAMNAIDARYIRSFSSNMGIATRLAQTTTTFKNPYFSEDSYKAMKAVTRADIQRVVSDYLTTNNRVVAWIERTEESAR